MSSTSANIVFLDRDGTINVDFGYVCSPSQIELIPGAADAIAQLCRAGFQVVIVTNQSAIARGYATEEAVVETNNALQAMLISANPDAKIAQVIYAPDSPDAASDRRKPGIGMLRDLLPQLQNFSTSSSWIVGDKLSDIGFGKNALLPAKHCILVKTGDGEKDAATLSSQERTEITIAASIKEAAQIITSSTN